MPKPGPGAVVKTPHQHQWEEQDVVTIITKAGGFRIKETRPVKLCRKCHHIFPDKTRPITTEPVD